MTADSGGDRSATGVVAARPQDWAPCSDRSRERDDPVVATASRGVQWFLVEVQGPWGPNAFASSALGRELGQAIVHRVEAAGIRPLAIRRVARAAHTASDARGRSFREPQTVWRWAFVDSRPGHEEIRWGEVDDPRELLEVPLDGSTGIHSPDPIYCVCTHAKHDQCCAVRGRPVALAIADQFEDATWECSHLGGDRFAGTMAIFPEGLYFGRADEVDAAQIVRDYHRGRVDERFFRGRSSISHAAQAAQHYARVHFGDDRLSSFAPVAENPQPGESGETEVLFEGGVRVVVTETLSEPLLSTCAAARFGRVREFALVSLVAPPAASSGSMWMAAG